MMHLSIKQYDDLQDEHDEYVSSDDISKIFEWLYVGTLEDYHKRNYEKYNVTHIISITDVNHKIDNNLDSSHHLIVHINDNSDGIISKPISQCLRFIKQVRNENGTLFVHCKAGRNRSIVVIAAYMLLSDEETLTEYRNDVDKCISFLEFMRGGVYINFGFMHKLEVFCSRYDKSFDDMVDMFNNNSW